MSSSVPEKGPSEVGGGVRVLGLDPSLTSFGVCRLAVGAGRKSFTYQTETWGPNAKGMMRLSWFVHKLRDVINDFRPHITVIEGYAYAKGQGAHQIGELGGAIRLMMYQNEVPYAEIAPSKLKKFATGKGNAKKEIVMVDLYKRFGIDVNTSDEADAAGLALMAAVGRFGLDNGLPQVNLSALEGVEW